MRNLISATLFCLLISGIGCSEKKNVYQLFENYLEENFDEEPKEQLYVILPIGSCKVCFDTTVDYLARRGYNEQITVILVGSTKLTLNLHKARIKDFIILMDSKNDFFKHDITDASYPTLLEIKKEKMINIIHGKSDNLNEIKRFIDSYY